MEDYFYALTELEFISMPMRPQRAVMRQPLPQTMKVQTSLWCAS